MATSATNRWKLGLFVVLGVGLMFATIVWLGSAGFRRETRSATSYFDESVQGLDIGSPVKFRGVPIGSVSGISIGPDLRHVEVTSEINLEILQSLGLPSSRTQPQYLDPTGIYELRVQLASAGITGVKFLQVDFFDKKRFPPMKLPFDPPSNYFPSTPSTLKSLEESLIDLSTLLPQLTQQAGGALESATKTLEAFSATLEPLVSKDGAVVGLLEQLRTTARTLDQSIRAAKFGETTASVRGAADSMGGMAADASGAALDLRENLETLREALESVRALADYLERDPGALLRGRSPEGE